MHVLRLEVLRYRTLRCDASADLRASVIACVSTEENLSIFRSSGVLYNPQANINADARSAVQSDSADPVSTQI